VIEWIKKRKNLLGMTVRWTNERDGRGIQEKGENEIKV
jgi:hypothetical protein